MPEQSRFPGPLHCKQCDNDDGDHDDNDHDDDDDDDDDHDHDDHDDDDHDDDGTGDVGKKKYEACYHAYYHHHDMGVS